jgi:hypothetical protein
MTSCEHGFEGPRVLRGEDREAVKSAGLLLCLEAGRPHKLVAEVGLAILDGEAGYHTVAVQECLFEAVALEHCGPVAEEGACAAQLREIVVHHAFSLSIQLHYNSSTQLTCIALTSPKHTPNILDKGSEAARAFITALSEGTEKEGSCRVMRG